MTDAPAPAASIRPTVTTDLPEVARLHDVVFGPGAYTRTAYRIREAAARPISPYCVVSRLNADDRLIAALRFTRVRIGGIDGAVLLGPLCVAADLAGQGFGRALVADGLARARAGGERVVLLVGDASYYRRFEFSPVPLGQITMPGPVDGRRLLAADLEPGAIAAYRGMIEAL